MSFNQNLSHFLSQSDGVGQTLFMLLIAMSVGSWYFIIIKAWQGMVGRRRTRRFLDRFWDAASLDEVAQNLNRHRDGEPFSHLTYHASTPPGTMPSMVRNVCRKRVPPTTF